jgi:precorrin-2 dehydrogenase / sirohydrochlorin ferrochelatase
MADLSLNLRLLERLCLVAGGGAVGLRKAKVLLDAGARVRLVSPEISASSELENIQVLRRPFEPADLDGVLLAFAATGDRVVNATVAREARARGILVSVADRPEEGDFTLPAVLRRGNLIVSVGTGGASPALASLVRDRLGEVLGEEWQSILAIASAIRQKSLTPQSNSAYNSQVLRSLLEGGLPDLVSLGDAPAIDRLLERVLGESCTLANLDVSISKGKR